MGRTKGKQRKAQRIVIYGPEGIGKSTYASSFPDALFLDVEDGTNELDVYRWDPRPESYTAFKDALKEMATAIDVGTIVVDTIDAVEALMTSHICAERHVSGIEDIGYGKGYTYLAEEMGKLLNFLTNAKDKGYNIVLLAHAMMRKFEQPDEMGAYDRWELKLQKKTAPLVKEWADMVLFANYETLVIENETTKKKKAMGGKRIIHTAHHPCWDAKNRHGLPEKISFDYKEISHCVPNIIFEQYGQKISELAQNESLSEIPNPYEGEENQEKVELVPQQGIIDKVKELSSEPVVEGAPPQLLQLMKRDNVSEADIQGAVSRQGYYPVDTPIKNYEDAFISGVLVAKWDAVKTNINNFKLKKGA